MNDVQILELVKELPPLQVFGITPDKQAIEVSPLYTADLSIDRMIDLINKLRTLIAILNNQEEE